MIRIFLIVVMCTGVGACTSNFSAAYNMYRALEKPDPNRFVNFQMNPNFQYLEAHSATSQAMLALGFTTTPANQPAIQTWYDSEQQLLRLQNGFLVSLTGIGNTVTSTEYTWAMSNTEGIELPTAKTYSQPERQIFNKTVKLEFKAVPVDSVNTKNSVLRQRITQQNPGLTWYQEVSTKDEHIPSALYAFAPNGVPVYGSQCLTARECLEWLYRVNTATRP